jgi:hypothetical protein
MHHRVRTPLVLVLIIGQTPNRLPTDLNQLLLDGVIRFCLTTTKPTSRKLTFAALPVLMELATAIMRKTQLEMTLLRRKTNMSGRLGILMVFVVITGCAKRRVGNTCPIDGAPAEYSKRISKNSCQYFHFSAVERQMHSWVADCVK